jgi:zinc transport system ATP-binding protein
MNQPLIEIKGLTAGYNGEPVIRNVNLSIFENDFLGVIGPNGGGKSTLMKAIMGLLKYSSGEIIFSRRLKFGYLPQFSLSDIKFPITVRDVVLSGLMADSKLFRRFSSEQKNKADLIIERFGLKNYSGSPFGELSGGQIQRTFLCRAIVSDPDILILDEPTAFTDEGFSKNLYSELAVINKTTAIVMVSHDTGVISSYVKNIACVNKTLHYHPGSDLTPDILDKYSCPVEILAHGPVPHRVLYTHKDKK